MFLKINVAGLAALAMLSIGFGLTSGGSPAANAQPGAYEAPVTVKAAMAATTAIEAPRFVPTRPHLAADASSLNSADAVPAGLTSSDEDDVAAVKPAASLAALVADQDEDEALNANEHCLATAIYHESRSESLAGQLAVARVIINRAGSGRFPTSLCGVVTQPGQFSFVRGGRLPETTKNSAQWRNARAITQIAMDDSWESQAEGALFFHAKHVSPGWARKRLTQIDNHIFYR